MFEEPMRKQDTKCWRGRVIQKIFSYNKNVGMPLRVDNSFLVLQKEKKNAIFFFHFSNKWTTTWDRIYASRA